MINARVTLLILSAVMLAASHRLELGNFDSPGSGAVPLVLAIITLLSAVSLPSTTPPTLLCKPAIMVCVAMLIFAVMLEFGLIAAVISATVVYGQSLGIEWKKLLVAITLNALITVAIFSVLLEMPIALWPWN